MPPKQPFLFKEFALAMLDHWKTWVSSTFIAVVIGLFLEAGGVISRLVLIVWAIVAGIPVAAFLAWRDERRKVLAFEERLEPKIEIRVELNPPINKGHDFRNRFLRLEVENICDSDVENCEAKLIKIEKEGVSAPLWGPDAAILTFAPWNPPHDCEPKKTIRNGDTVHLDILYIREKWEICMGTRDRQWLLMPRLPQIFYEPGDYVLTVRITGDGLKTETVALGFKCTGNWMTSVMTRITPPSQPTPPTAISSSAPTS